MRIITLILILFMLNIPIVQATPYFNSTINAWIDTDKNIVYIDDTKTYMESPYIYNTSNQTEAIFNLSLKTHSDYVDIVFGFNTNKVKPTKAEIYNPYWTNTTIEKSFYFSNVTDIVSTSNPCEIGEGNIKRQITYLEGNTTITACFDNYIQNNNNYTIYWTEEQNIYKKWQTIPKTRITKKSFIFQTWSEWYLIEDVYANQNQLYTLRITLTPSLSLESINTKFFYGAKLSSDTLAQALINNRLYVIDPWYITPGYLYRKEIILSGSETDYPTRLNISDAGGGIEDFDLESHATDFSQDIVFADSDETTAIPYHLTKDSIDPTAFFVNVSDTSNPIYAYYGKIGATTLSDGNTTYGVYDSFEDSTAGIWTTLTGSPDYGSTDQAYMDSQSVHLVSGSPAEQIETDLIAENGYAIGFRLWKNAAGDFYILHGNGTYMIYSWIADSTREIKYYDTSTQGTGTYITISRWEWIEYRDIDFIGHTFDIYLNDVLVVDDAGMRPLGVSTDVIHFESVITETVYIDEVYTRKYTKPEPKYSSSGIEETETYIPNPPNSLIATPWANGINYEWILNHTNNRSDYTNISLNITNPEGYWVNVSAVSEYNHTTGCYNNTTSQPQSNISIWSWNSTRDGELSLTALNGSSQALNCTPAPTPTPTPTPTPVGDLFIIIADPYNSLSDYQLFDMNYTLIGSFNNSEWIPINNSSYVYQIQRNYNLFDNSPSAMSAVLLSLIMFIIFGGLGLILVLRWIE